MLSLPRLYTRQSPQFLCLLALNLGFLIYTRMSPTSHLDPSALVQSLPVHIPDHLPSLYAHQQSHLHTRNHTGDFTSRASSKKKRVARAFSSGAPLILSPSRHVPTGAHTLSHPTATCEVCVATPDDPLCEYGLDNVRLSRSYEGSGHRVRKFLEKALRGEKVRIGIIGGSVTAGHGLNGKPSWHQRFFTEFQQAFPNSEIFDGSVPAMGSAFFSYCFESLIPNDLDLYIAELDINNEAIDRTFGEDDALFRGLLGLPQEPAVIRLSVVATSFPDLALGHVSDLIMSTYFDTPIISIRNFLLPHFIAHPELSDPYFSILPDGTRDYRHISHIGHNALADMLTLYMREQTCEARRRMEHPAAPPKSHWPKSDILGMVPRLYMWQPFSTSKVAPPVRPHCEFMGSERRPLTPIAESTSPSWKQIDWNGKHALVSNEVGARVSFPFTGTKIGLFLLQTNGKRNTEFPGKLGCWLDGETDVPKVPVDAWYADDANRAYWHMVKDGVPFAEHVLHCEILEESSTSGHEVRILGVASQ